MIVRIPQNLRTHHTTFHPQQRPLINEGIKCHTPTFTYFEIIEQGDYPPNQASRPTLGGIDRLPLKRDLD